MKFLPLTLIGLLFFSACGLNQQAKKIKALGDCDYRIYSIDEMELAGTDVMKMVKNRSLDLTQMPRLAMGFLSRDIPLQSTISFEIVNPTKHTAEIQEFDYEVLVNDHLLTEGTYAERLTIPAQDTSYVPITLQTNVYTFLSNDTLRNQIQNFFFSAREGAEQTATLTIKVKPGVKIGEKIVKYPSFISFDRKLSNRFLFRPAQ